MSKQTSPENLMGLELKRAHRRCMERGLDPNLKRFAQCPAEKVEAVKKKSMTTFAYSNRVINVPMEHVHDPYLGLAVFDQDGWLLRLYGSPTFKRWARLRGIVPFSNWSEESAGVNAFSLGMELNRSVEVFGMQNYCTLLQDTAIYFTPYVLDTGLTFSEKTLKRCGGVAVITPLREHVEDYLLMTSAIAKEVCLHLHMVDTFDGFFNTDTAGHISVDIDMATQKPHLLYHSANIYKILDIAPRNLHFEEVNVVFDLPPKNKEFWSIITEGLPVSDKKIVLSVQGKEREFSIRTLPFKQRFVGFQGIHIFLQSQKLQSASVSINAGNVAQMSFKDIIGSSPAMQHTLQQAEMLSNNDRTLLILGESGVGKDLFARAIHSASCRSQGPFVNVNCAAIPRELIASELFGYAGGAFTGAKRGGNMGKFELADSGTIFLDEIGDMPLDLQAALLEVLESKSFMRVGSNVRKQVDVRVIAATNANLTEKIEKRQFREDLYYRLSAIQLFIPPLRVRDADIILLAESFMRKMSEEDARQVPALSPEAKQLLCSLPWRGNVRELRNTITSLMSLCHEPVIEAEHVRLYLANSQHYRGRFEEEYPLILPPALSVRSRRVSREELEEYLKNNQYNKALTAKQLGISRKTLYRWLKKFDLPY